MFNSMDEIPPVKSKPGDRNVGSMEWTLLVPSSDPWGSMPWLLSVLLPKARLQPSLWDCPLAEGAISPGGGSE